MDKKTGRSITYAVHEFKPQISTHLARSSSIKNAVHLNKDYNFNMVLRIVTASARKTQS